MLPCVADVGAPTLVIARSVTGRGGGGGGGGALPSIRTPKLLSTRSMRLAIVCVLLPANNKPTGRLVPSSETMSEPESPPPENVPGSMIS